jgi:predicted nuclease of predicted toxin-antitoxin system
VKFLVDAQLPRRLCAVLVAGGCDAVHTLELPAGNATKDRDINQISVEGEWVVISKDLDFFYSHVLHRRPWKLLLVRTGNISTADLCGLFERNREQIVAALETHTLVELDRGAVTPVI